MTSYRNYHTKSKSRFDEIMEGLNPYFFQISRYLLAIVFVFSGFVKAVDPLGTTYKIEDYLAAFGEPWSQFSFIALWLSIALSAFELVIGLNLLFKIKIRTSAVLAMIFMLVMTPLTLYIALNNPVTDCGCFGDALIISNWETFWKNVVLLVLVVILLFSSAKSRPVFLSGIEWLIITVFVGISAAISLYSYNFLPMIDFRPYKIGSNIPEKMKIPEGAPTDKYETTFIYEKNGEQKEFTLENYPKDDSTWVFVDQKTTLISKGYEAPIHNFSIIDQHFDDITEDVLQYKGGTYLVVVYDIQKASPEGLLRAEDIYKKHKDTGTRFYALTGSSDDAIASVRAETGITFPFCKTDPITLKTIIRANPGLVYLENGTVKGKWNWRDF
ncbi:MAG: DoxX family protein [Paludibacter sp.]|nr:DoxX family protein [Paludibacter sp.]